MAAAAPSAACYKIKANGFFLLQKFLVKISKLD